MPGLRDETRWGRPARPEVRIRAGGEPAPLHRLEAAGDDPDPKALARSGSLRGDAGGMPRRPVRGRPASRVTGAFPDRACGRLAAAGERAWLLTRDNAGRHVRERVRSGIAAHDRRVERRGGVRIVASGLPIGAPGSNRIEPRRVHGKRAILGPDRERTADEGVDRVHEHFGCDHCERLAQNVA